MTYILSLSPRPTLLGPAGAPSLSLSTHDSTHLLDLIACILTLSSPPNVAANLLHPLFHPPPYLRYVVAFVLAFVLTGNRVG